jgi:hypothetical protein
LELRPVSKAGWHIPQQDEWTPRNQPKKVEVTNSTSRLSIRSLIWGLFWLPNGSTSRWVGSRAKALEDLRELDELLEDELIEEVVLGPWVCTDDVCT